VKNTKLIYKIKSNEAARAELEPSIGERNEYLLLANELMQNFLTTIDEDTAFSNNPSQKEKFVISEKGEDLEKSLATIKSEVLDNGIRAASGGHLGYIPGGGLYTAALGDYIAAVSNAYSGMYYASPGAVEMELACIDWLKSIFQFPDSAIGNLTSGGSIANLIALTAARDTHGIKNEKIPRAVIYMGEQTHHCVHKAIRIIGLTDAIIRNIPLDESGKMISNELKIAIKNDKIAGLIPFVVIASAGTTDVGAVDPLNEIGDIAKNENLWYHIDAAYGGFFVLTEEKKSLFNGIEKADSLVIDPHKGLFLPYGIGAVLVKDRNAVFKSHHYAANYMQDAFEDTSTINPADVSPELTKHFRALRMWLPLKIHGVSPFKASLKEKLLLTQYFRDKIQEIGFCVGPEPDLTVSYFWFPAKNENDFNKKLLHEMHEDGSVFFSSTVLKGKFVIRVAILSFRTNIDTIDRSIKMIERCLNRIK
jgi:glutamate/tyrosine decarboxylase-like PLP-dependent enzyme